MTIFGKQVQPGSRVLVHLLDDKEFWNTAWNSLLKTPVHISFDGKFISSMVRANLAADTTIRLIDKDITFQAPGHMAQAEILVPSSTDGIWCAQFRLISPDKNDVGVLEFGQVWTAKPSLLRSIRLSQWSMVFWGGMACVLAITFIGRFFTTRNPQSEKNTGA